MLRSLVRFACCCLSMLAADRVTADEFLWAGRLGGTLGGMALDAGGNVYTVGHFIGTFADFDPGPGTHHLHAAGMSDVFITKLDNAGNFVWARRLGGLQADRGTGVAVDLYGDPYIVGSFEGTADFDPGPGTYNLTSAGLADVFISKLDSAGNFVWARQIGGSATDSASAVALDASGNVYTGGAFDGTSDFDPGPGAYNLSTAGDRDVFISKLDGAGNFIWARRLGGATNDTSQEIAVDGSGNVYTVGQFGDAGDFSGGSADFDPGPGVFLLTSAGHTDVFISKLDAAGNFVWAKAFGNYLYQYAIGVAVDGSGNVYTVGLFADGIDFDPGPGTYWLSHINGAGTFILKLDSAGSFVWARLLSGDADSYSYTRGDGITVDNLDNVHVVGFFDYNTDLDPGPGVYSLTASLPRYDGFIVRLDGAGNFAWGGQLLFSGDWNNTAYAVAAYGNDQVFIGGTFDGTADFDPGPGTYNLTPSGPQNTFIMSLATVRAAGDLGDSLAVNLVDEANIRLSWNTSCVATDDDYVIYEGTIGNWNSHVPHSCTTGGATALLLVPSAGSTYYIVVPRNSWREGSYGRASDGTERPASVSACAVQEMAAPACP